MLHINIAEGAIDTSWDDDLFRSDLPVKTKQTLQTMNRRHFIAAALALPMVAARCGTGGRLDRLGASTACVAGVPLLDAIRSIEQLGFGTIEMIAYTGAKHSMGDIPGFDYYEASESERRQVYDATRAFRHISAHMPFTGLHFLSSDAAVRQTAVDEVKQAIDGLAFLQGSMAVVHAGWPEEGKTFRDVWPLMLETFRSLGDYAAERGIKIGLETMQPNSVADYTQLIVDIDHPAVGATVDTGHIRGATDIGLPVEQRSTEEGTERFNDVLTRTVLLLGEKLLHVHLTDVQRSDWRDHKTVGSGIIDFARFFDALHSVEYGGLLVFELEEPDQIAALQASKAHVEGILKKK